MKRVELFRRCRRHKRPAGAASSAGYEQRRQWKRVGYQEFFIFVFFPHPANAINRRQHPEKTKGYNQHRPERLRKLDWVGARQGRGDCGGGFFPFKRTIKYSIKWTMFSSAAFSLQSSLAFSDFPRLVFYPVFSVYLLLGLFSIIFFFIFFLTPFLYLTHSFLFLSSSTPLFLSHPLSYPLCLSYIYSLWFSSLSLFSVTLFPHS